ncbi:MAG TPA: ATP-binding protein [Roseiflexaceae bacterium]|nr:ATP-binding protein [Roseiflexaceae bacterium]
MRLIRELRSHLHYKIILPFLLLTLLVALAGSAVSFLLIAGTSQERLNNQLAQVARDLSDKLVQQESDNLLFLREVVFAQANPEAGAPAVADALAAHDTQGLQRALDPYFRISTQRSGVRVDRMLVFDTARASVLDWERPRDQADPSARVSHKTRDLGALWFVPRILAGQRDDQGDKYAGLLDLGDSNTRYLFTVAPVMRDNQVVGGLLIATRLDTLLQDLNAQSQAAIIGLYQAEDGTAFASTTTPAAGLATLNIRSDLVLSIRDLQLAEKQSIFDVVTVNQRNYQFAYAPLRIRGSAVGLISVALASDYVTGPWADAGVPLTLLTISLMLAIIGLGIYIARQITRPLQELVSTAQAVTAGDLERRSRVTARDEVGILSQSFNEMTGHLLDLYRAVRAEASQRAAIVDSITDGVIVCDPAGEVQVLNRTTRVLLGLADGQPGPRRFEDIPLQVLGDTTPLFGESRATNLFTLGDRIIRVAAAPVLGDDGARLGDVYVLQDLTDEVAMDRAKNNFIATISHELRTPLTVLSGTSELLLRNMVGTLSDDQRSLIESMRKHTMTMNALLSNVITIANLEAGTLSLDLEPVGLSGVLEGVIWPIRAGLAAKGLELVIDLPEDLPEIVADEPQLRIVLYQLLDNARRYTDRGWVAVRAIHQSNLVRVDITDTGRGISPDFCEHLFTRFTRGSEGINSAERGIGLGLAIARELIERQQGVIWLDHTSEQGSTFSFTLPCVQVDSYVRDSSLATAA